MAMPRAKVPFISIQRRLLQEQSDALTSRMDAADAAAATARHATDAGIKLNLDTERQPESPEKTVDSLVAIATSERASQQVEDYLSKFSGSGSALLAALASKRNAAASASKRNAIAVNKPTAKSDEGKRQAPSLSAAGASSLMSKKR